LRLRAQGAEAAGLDPDRVLRDRGVAGRRHEVDRAAERRGAVGEPVAALEDLDRADRQRVDLVEVAGAVGEVHRDAVLEDLDAAQVEAAGDAGAADREAQLLPVAVLPNTPGTSFSTSRSVLV